MNGRIGVVEAARHVGCTIGEIRRSCKRGRFPFVILGGRYLFEREALDTALREEACENMQKARERWTKK